MGAVVQPASDPEHTEQMMALVGKVVHSAEFYTLPTGGPGNRPCIPWTAKVEAACRRRKF